MGRKLYNAEYNQLFSTLLYNTRVGIFYRIMLYYS